MKTRRVWCCAVILAGLCQMAGGGSLQVDDLFVTQTARLYGEFQVGEGDAPPQCYFSFDTAAAGGVVLSEGVSAYTGTLYGSVSLTTGNVGGAYYFGNSTGHYINVAYDSALQLAGPFTLAAWIKPEVPEDSGAPGIIIKGADLSSIQYGLAWFSPGQIGFWSTGGSSSILTTNSPAPTGTWKHVVGVLEGSGSNQAKIYVNGVLVKTGTMNLPSALSGERPLYIGRWRDEYYYRGFIDDVRIYTHALSAADVQALYSNTISSAYTTNMPLHVAGGKVTVRGETTIQHLIRQGDVDMGAYTNGP